MLPRLGVLLLAIFSLLSVPVKTSATAVAEKMSVIKSDISSDLYRALKVQAKKIAYVPITWRKEVTGLVCDYFQVPKRPASDRYVCRMNPLMGQEDLKNLYKNLATRERSLAKNGVFNKMKTVSDEFQVIVSYTNTPGAKGIYSLKAEWAFGDLQKTEEVMVEGEEAKQIYRKMQATAEERPASGKTLWVKTIGPLRCFESIPFNLPFKRKYTCYMRGKNIFSFL